jgi:flagellar M-ring protein FliF
VSVIETSQALAKFNEVSAMPVARQLGLLVGLAASIALGLSVVFWAQEPDYTPLYSNLSEMDAAEVIQSLESSGVEYEFSANSGLISVPTESIHKVRLMMAGEGLPRGSEGGFSFLQKEQGLGTSAFMETARYNQAVAEELQRSIASLDAIQSARVHLAVPEKSAFIRNRTKANASVVVSLARGRSLDDDQVAGIVYLVASSVTDLEPGNVTLIDQRGRLLSGNNASESLMMSTEQLRYTRDIENALTSRVADLIVPLVGYQNVKVQVTAEIDHTSEERTIEQYGQQGGVIRSEQTQEEISNQVAARGVPGALANNPDTVSEAQVGQVEETATDDRPARESRSATRNYEVDRTISHIKESGGQISRLAVAVVLNHRMVSVPAVEEGGEPTMQSIPVPDEELARIEGIVREAVGFSAVRGDSLSVTTAPFFEEVIALPPEPSWYESMGDYTGALKTLAGFALILVLILGVLRPVLKSIVVPPMQKNQQQLVASDQDDGEEVEVEYDSEGRAIPMKSRPLDEARALERQPQSYDQQLIQARNLVNEDPERVAQVMKTWVSSNA